MCELSPDEGYVPKIFFMNVMGFYEKLKTCFFVRTPSKLLRFGCHIL